MRTLFVVCIAMLVGCSSSKPVPQPTRFDRLFDMASQLQADAEKSVSQLTGVAVSADVTVVLAHEIALPGALAVRDGRTIELSVNHPLDQRELYDTLVHEMLHMVLLPDGLKGDASTDLDVLRFQGACMEAWVWRFAAELTADRFGGAPRYFWDDIPQCTFPRDVIVEYVMERPADIARLARDYQEAADTLAAFNKALTAYASQN